MPRTHCFLVIDADSDCWGGERVSCFVDGRNESWGACTKRIFEREVAGTDFLLLRTLVDIYPEKRLSIYRLRYGNGFNTIIHVEWQEEGGINSEAPLENAYVEVIVSVVPVADPPVHDRYLDPELSALSGLESAGLLNKKGSVKCLLVSRLLVPDESPLTATAEGCNFINVAEAEGIPGFIDGCTIKPATLEEVNNLLTGMLVVNFPNMKLSDYDDSKVQVEIPPKRTSKVEAGPVEVDVSGQGTGANKPAAKPAVASKRAKSNEKSQAKDQNKPKAPLTAFNLFAKDRRQDIKKSNPDKKPNEISVLVGEAWKALPDDERKQYLDVASEKRAEYKEALARYDE